MVKTLARSLREYKKGSILAILLSVLEVVFEIVIPVLAVLLALIVRWMNPIFAQVLEEKTDIANP